MSNTINLAGNPYPFERTPEGAGYLQQLNVNFKAVKQRKPEALQKYAYCIAAGAAQAQNVDFDFTLEKFIKACPHNWIKQVNKLLNEPEKTNESSKAKSPKAKTTEKEEKAKKAKSDETTEK